MSNKIVDISGLERFFDNIKNYISGILSNKVDKVQGKDLSTEDFTTELKSKLSQVNILAEDAKTVIDDINKDTYIKYVVQSLTDEEKRQARKNIDAISIDELPEYKPSGPTQNISIMTSISYDELKTLKENSQLIPGAAYRITDYVCTTTQPNTIAINNRFDIIVIADSENVLNETAYATYHEGDTYFSHNNLEAWELKYCFDNDINRFAWADVSSGKGVIYYMKDDRNNECPYDFKNILFYSAGIIGSENFSNYYYTFSYIVDNVLYDGTTEERVINCYSNIIKTQIVSNKRQLLNNIFCNTNFYSYCFSNTFGYNCYSNTFGDNCYSNTFGYNCYSNTFGNDCMHNTFGNECYSNSFGNGCTSNTFGDRCTYLNLGTSMIEIGTSLMFTSFEDDCNNITITKSKNTAESIYPKCKGLKFGINCKYLTICSNKYSDSDYLQNYTINNFVGGNDGDDRLIINLPSKTSLGRNYETKIGLNSYGEVVQYCEADFVLPPENSIEVEVGDDYIKLNSDDIITTDNSVIIDSDNVAFETNTPNNENYSLIIEI